MTAWPEDRADTEGAQLFLAELLRARRLKREAGSRPVDRYPEKNAPNIEKAA